MTSFIFKTIIEFSAAIRNVSAQFLNAFVEPADLFVPTRNKSSSYYSYYYSHTFSNPLSETTIKATELKFAHNA